MVCATGPLSCTWVVLTTRCPVCPDLDLQKLLTNQYRHHCRCPLPILFICPSVCCPLCLFICPSVCCPARLSVYLSSVSFHSPFCLFVHVSVVRCACLFVLSVLSACLPVYLSVCLLSARFSVYLSFYLLSALPFYLFVRVSVVRSPFCLFVCLSVVPLCIFLCASVCCPLFLPSCPSVWCPLCLFICPSVCCLLFLPSCSVCCPLCLFICPSVCCLSVCLFSARLSVVRSPSWSVFLCGWSVTLCVAGQ